ncbi:hypothetical protein [Roseovarius sp.]|uniref:hypothetical protein n=2 Tax=Roseovarius sp. TaxID=1486281 RepID=UPI0025EE0AF4|nr:hypothetical protein [Roseovarius sp.]
MTHIKVKRGDSGHAWPMTRITRPFLITCLLALSLALGSLTAGRAAGFAAVEATLTEMVICAGAEGEKSVHVTRDGAPVDLPHCDRMLCDACLQAGSHAVVFVPFHIHAPRTTRAIHMQPGKDLHHPTMIRSARNRAPPVGTVLP